jgi:hypothetical protein
LKNLTTPAIFS